MLRVQFNASEKLAVLQELESGQIGVMAVAKKYGITKTTLAKWQRRYRCTDTKG